MAKSKAAKALVFRCVSCGHVEVKWLGRCPGCGEWNSLRESTAKGDEGPARAGESFPVPIGAIDASEASRMSTGLGEFDRVLGGGLLRGSAILIGGEPGIGKSTLLLQVAASCAVSGRVLYVSGEESPAQIRMRAGRLDAVREGLEVFASGNLATIRAAS
jgi:DNA repair protein RadA/Sms